MSTSLDYIPLSMLNQLAYCERRFYLMHVLGEMEINAHVLEGTLRHEKAHDAGAERAGDTLVHRRVYVWSEALGVAGFTDLVEEALTPGPSPSGRGGIVPIEYKKGRMGRWISDHVQLCAQAMCLEERLGVDIAKGYIFYFGSRRREEVSFTAELRERTRQAAARARELIPLLQPPPPLAIPAKCRDCSLQPICLPEETRQLSK